MFKVLYNIFTECRHYILKGLPKKEIKKNKKGDITKYFDKFIENKIILLLKKGCKFKASILSEELQKPVEINFQKPGDTNYIIIDPVDGSDNYTVGIPFVCMGLSIFDYKKNPVFSFVGNYFSGDWIYADEKKILFNKKEKIKNKKILIFTFSKFKINYKTQNLINYFNIIRSFGATIGEMIMVAKGQVDAFIDLRNKLTLENFAPFFLIAKHLNLKLTDEQGKDIILTDFSMTKGYKIIFGKDNIIKKIKYLIQ